MTLRQASEKARDPEVVALKPCPFCGGNARQFIGLMGSTLLDKKVFHIACSVCDLEMRPYQLQAEAIAAWNRRSPDILPLIEALEGAERALAGVNDMLLNKGRKEILSMSEQRAVFDALTQIRRTLNHD